MNWQELLDLMRELYPDCPLCGGAVAWSSIDAMVLYDARFRVHTVAGLGFGHHSEPAWRGKCEVCEWWIEMGSRGEYSGADT